MTGRALLRDSPSLRELLARATWDDLHRIAARHSVALGGRRRDLAVERLAAVLERPEQLRAAERILPESTRAVFSLLLLLGSVEDERSLSAARDALLAVRSDLEPLLGRAHLANELQTLVSLGLVFRDRRRLAAPLEVLQTIAPQIVPARPSAPPNTPHPSYAEAHYRLERLVALVDQQQPIAIPPPAPASDRATLYQALALPPDHAAALGAAAQIAPGAVAVLLAILEAAGILGTARGHWQRRAEWSAFRELPPRDRLTALSAAWRAPRSISDLVQIGGLGWVCAPDTDGATVIGQYEAQLRTIGWRWLGWCGAHAWTIADFAATLAALHGALLIPDDRAVALVVITNRNAPLTSTDAPRVAQVFVQQWLAQLADLGLVVSDDTAAMLTPPGAWLIHNMALPYTAPAIRSAGSTDIFVQPLSAEPDALRLLAIAGALQPPSGEWAHYTLTAHGIGRLSEQQITIAEFEQALRAADAQLGDELRAQLRAWTTRAGRLHVHQPLTVLVTAEDVPLAQVLSVAGLDDAAEVIGPGCALIEAERAEAAMEQLRARGFWPRIIG